MKLKRLLNVNLPETFVYHDKSSDKVLYESDFKVKEVLNSEVLYTPSDWNAPSFNGKEYLPILNFTFGMGGPEVSRSLEEEEDSQEQYTSGFNINSWIKEIYVCGEKLNISDLFVTLETMLDDAFNEEENKIDNEGNLLFSPFENGFIVWVPIPETWDSYRSQKIRVVWNNNYFGHVMIGPNEFEKNDIIFKGYPYGVDGLSDADVCSGVKIIFESEEGLKDYINHWLNNVLFQECMGDASSEYPIYYYGWHTIIKIGDKSFTDTVKYNVGNGTFLLINDTCYDT